ncbi:MAG: alanine racemase [Chloroflexota bacterium]|nr:alanine racemase [Chloroflexota bacterium]
MDITTYSTWLEIDLGAIKHNVKEIIKMTNAEVMAVIKANGYGHGVLQVAKAVVQAGATWCGVARMEEALNLRRAGIDAQVMVLGYTPAGLIPDAIKNDIHVAIYDTEMARLYADQARKVSGKLKAHLKVETGMGRLGMPLEQAIKFLAQVHNHDAIHIDGIFTHLARADEPRVKSAAQQLGKFKLLLDQLRDRDLCPDMVHAANSAAVINFPEAYFDLVRPGIAIYGLDPSQETRLPETFKPALTWKAKIISVRGFPPGHGISYGSVYVTSKQERIGVIPVGYGDGYRRETGQQVLVRGQLVDVVGRICMDQCMIQLDSVPDAVVGDEVVLLGQQGEHTITANDLATGWGTINYEVICGLADRLPRLYKRS